MIKHKFVGDSDEDFVPLHPSQESEDFAVGARLELQDPPLVQIYEGNNPGSRDESFPVPGLSEGGQEYWTFDEGQAKALLEVAKVAFQRGKDHAISRLSDLVNDE